ncbi:SDR family oxidoreductase [Streptomyces albidoflavus]|uniref:SDR family oxidoreductase n=1 Tax=Streptomyces albidoflavus TaxID=1886 RepID=UPI0036D2E703
MWSRRPVPDEEHSLSAEGLSTAGGGIPAGRVGRPEGVARAIRFLTSDDAWYITGQQLVVDGHGAGPGRDRGPRPSRRRPRRPDRAPVRLPRRARRVPALRRTAARLRPRRSLDRALAVAALLPGAPSPTPRNPP